MKPAAQGSTVAVVGASTLLGKEVMAVLKERAFPVARMVAAGGEAAHLDLPVLDLNDSYEADLVEEDISESDLDFIFVAGELRPATAGSKRVLLRSPERLAEARHAVVIDLGGFLAGHAAGILRVPFLEREGTAGTSRKESSRHLVSAHPAVIVVAALLARLAARSALESAVAHVFSSASEIGPRAIEELQRQTVNLLSFQKLPQSVFGAQLAFNLLPRIGRGRASPGNFALLERRIRDQLRELLGNNIPLPALRLVQAPVFHSLAVSLYVRTREPAPLDAMAKALANERVQVRMVSETAPSPVEVTGSRDILVDALTPDPSQVAGFWVWATADNLRLAATNAVEIAEAVKEESE